MKTRIISAAIALAAFIGVAAAPVGVMKIVLLLLTVIGIYEIFKTCGYIKYIPLFVAAVITAAVVGFYDFAGCYGIFIALLIFAVVGVFTLLFRHEEFSSKDFSSAVLLALLVSVSLQMPVALRGMEHGKYYFWLPFVASWSTDTFAYFGGKLFGKHKLCEKLSPNKTVEGGIGGVVGAIIGIVVFSLFSRGKVNYIYTVIYAIIVSVLSQAGDIFASAIKREYNVKDFGNLMPGHGGVMDRFDSLLLTAPFTFLFLKLTSFM